jgi:hydrogenase 3 maturation protease
MAGGIGVIHEAKESVVATAIETRLRGTVVIVGMGNTLRSDDGAGPRFIEMLSKKLHGAARFPVSVHLMNCHQTPENYIGPIAHLQPHTVVLVDCVSLGLLPGEIRIVKAGALLDQPPSTHTASPALFMNRLKQETGADVFMIAVQPATTSFGESLSMPVRHALTELADRFQTAIEHMQHGANLRLRPPCCLAVGKSEDEYGTQ